LRLDSFDEKDINIFNDDQEEFEKEHDQIFEEISKDIIRVVNNTRISVQETIQMQLINFNEKEMPR